jgi:peptidoglycan/LPS O-acetylase OafA/YrhL
MPALDGLRGVAIVIVMLDHAGFSTFPVSGNVGVTVFFVLSGFLITCLLVGEHRSAGRIDLRGFYVRRALRLLPALVVLLVVASILMVLVGRSDEILGDVGPTLFYFMNWTKAAGEDAGYLSHAWSLSIEEQFYVIWPLLLVGALSVLRLPLRWIGLLTAALAALAAAWRLVLWAPENFDRVFWSTDTRADALLVGSAVALILAGRQSRLPVAVTAASAGTIVAVLLLGDVASFATTGLLLVAVASAVLVVGITADNPVTRMLGWAPLVYVGTISYGLYLFHRPVMRLGSGWDFDGQVIPAAVMFAVSVGLAWLSMRYVERPFLALKHRGWARPAASPVPSGTTGAPDAYREAASAIGPRRDPGVAG